MSNWSPERDAELRTLCAQDDPQISYTEIAARMGISKNAVVGRAHRLHLPARPSPIRARVDGLPTRDALRAARAEQRAVRVRSRQDSAQALRDAIARQPARPTIPARVAGDPGPAGSLGVTSNGGRVTGLSAPENSPPVPPAVPGVFSERGCRFPLWSNTERPDHRYCAAPVAQGAYCAHHAARCYDVSRPKGVGALPPTFGWRAA